MPQNAFLSVWIGNVQTVGKSSSRSLGIAAGLSIPGKGIAGSSFLWR